MQLIVANDTGTHIVVLDDLGSYLEHGLLTVQLEKVAQVLAAIRAGAVAAVEPDSKMGQTDPARLELISQQIVSVAGAARALAAEAPADDPNAKQIMATLATLGLDTDPSTPAPPAQAIR